MTTLNIMIPQYILEYAVISFFVVSLIEGLIINIGTKRKFHNRFGLSLSTALNLASTIVGLFIGLSIFDNISLAVLGAFGGSVIVECVIAYFIGGKMKIDRIYVIEGIPVDTFYENNATDFDHYMNGDYWLMSNEENSDSNDDLPF